MTVPRARSGDAPPRPPKVAWLVRLGVLFLRVLAATWRIRTRGDDALRRLRRERQPVVFTLWHGEMLALLWQHRGEGVAVLISEHRDGEIIARIATSLRFRTVRGSTFRGAGRALAGLIRELKAGHDVAVTPDGPRGPAEHFAPGALVAAQRANAPVVAVRAAPSRCWRLGSWDRFMIPKPFARVTIAYEVATIDSTTVRDAAHEAPRFQELMERAGARAAEP